MLVDTTTRQYRANVAELERRSLNEVASAWAGLDLSRVADVRESLVDVAMAMGVTYGDASAVLAAEYFEDLRADSPATGSYSARIVNNLNEDAIRSDMGWAVDPLTREDPGTALKKASTVVGSLLLRSSSDTTQANVAQDRAAVGWYRIARANGCQFCVMLSQRGAVYKETTADFAAHGNCNCTAKPSWDPDAPEVSVQAYRASERTARMRELDRLDGGRRYENHKEYVNSWLENNTDSLDAFRSELL